MKGKFKSVVAVTTIGIALALAYSSQATVIFHPPRPVVVAPPVAPVVIAPGIPQSYIWDGTQYVGWIGNQFYYLGPGNVWMVMDPVRLNRFNSWQRSHPGWRNRAVRNTRYRNRGPVRAQPLPAPRPPPNSRSGGPPRSGRSNGPPSNQNQPPQNQGRGNRGQGGQGRGNRGQNNPPQ